MSFANVLARRDRLSSGADFGFAQAKIAFAPPPHFLTRSLIGLVSSVLFVSLLMIGCGGGGGDDNNRKGPSYFTVSFYDANLDFNGSISVDKSSPDINITKLKTDLNLSAPQLYRAGSAEKVEKDALYHITGDTNFYAIASVKEIRTEIELSAVRDNLSHNYILINDIALTSATLNETAGWEPIGDSYTAFTGILNGNGHKITGLYINSASLDVGLFGSLAGTVKNLGVEIDERGVTATGSYSAAGGIAGFVDGGSITNSYSTGNISGTWSAGGIVGYVDSGSITKSYSTGNISGTWSAGGIVGYVHASGSITNSYSTGDISGRYAGGIAGDVHASGSIANSYSTGNVNGICAGGIAGFVEYGGSITNSYSTGNISGESVGGIAGGVNDGVIITNCAAANGRITGGVLDRDDCYTGHRILGNGGVSGLSNNFANSDMTIQPPMVSCARDSSSNGIDKPLEELKTRSTYENAVDDGSGGLGWKFGDDDSNPWKIDAGKNNGFPYLYWQEF